MEKEKELFVIEDQTLVQYNGNEEKVVIPDTVKTIFSDVFSGNKTIRELYLPDSMTQIEWKAFSNMENLEVVRFPKNLKSIGEYAFAKSKIRSIEIPETVQTIEAEAFGGCKLEEIGFGNRTDFSQIYDNTLFMAARKCFCCGGVVEEVEEGWKCSECGRIYKKKKLKQWKKFVIRNGVLIKYLKGARSIEIPQGVTAIASHAFDDSTVLEVQIPDTVRTIGNEAFIWCDWLLHDFFFPPHLVRIEPRTLVSASAGNIYIGDEVEYIGFEAFAGSEHLQKMKIPSNVKVIAEEAFGECNVLSTLTIAEGTELIGEKAFEKCKDLRAITIPASVCKLGDYCFAGCEDARTLEFKEGNLMSIGKHAFDGCELLQEVILPKSLMSIGSGAFKGCKNLRKVTLPMTLKNIPMEDIFEAETEVVYRSDVQMYRL
ncbi:MAG: leucine-rich repeat domain-containing protein [Clostridia bacterium]|nr:leucine-rich repeat domain-containing protein [Clostridia bacterium]